MNQTKTHKIIEQYLINKADASAILNESFALLTFVSVPIISQGFPWEVD